MSNLTTETAPSVPTRRSLDLRTFDAVIAEIERLAAGPYARVGKWELGVTCNHLATATEVFLERRPVPLPLYMRMLGPLFGKMIFRRLLRTRSMPVGIKAPPIFAPVERCACDAEVARVVGVLRRTDAFTGPLNRHPIFGDISVEDWKQLVLIHCSHHLSFLVPTEGA